MGSRAATNLFFILSALLLICTATSTVVMGFKHGPTANAPTPPFGTLKFEDIVVGSGAPAKSGEKISAHYTGKLTDGTKFDSSVDRNQPLDFTVDVGQVIPGWDKGIAGDGTIPPMKVGGTRMLYIPSDMAYGARGAGGVIPPNADLIFEVELVSVAGDNVADL